MEKRGLVLEGGAMRGLFSAGVMDVFLENDIHFDALIGVAEGKKWVQKVKEYL